MRLVTRRMLVVDIWFAHIRDISMPFYGERAQVRTNSHEKSRCDSHGRLHNRPRGDNNDLER